MAEALILLFTLIPLLGGVTLIVLALRRVRDVATCGGCGYDISASVGLVTRCPECGGLFTKVGIRPPGRGSRPMLLIAGGGLILLTVGGFSSAMFQRWTAQRERMAAQAARLQAAQIEARAAAAIAEGEAMRLEAVNEALDANAPPAQPAAAGQGTDPTPAGSSEDSLTEDDG